VDTQLRGTKENFKKILQERINIGNELYNRNIQTREQFGQAERERTIWNDYNSELLKQSFNIIYL
jgi:hypothetical protein